MTQLTPEQLSKRNAILQGFITRADELELKGKERDKAGLYYMIGACSALQAVEADIFQNLWNITCLLFAPRGTYTEAKRILAGE